MKRFCILTVLITTALLSKAALNPVQLEDSMLTLLNQISQSANDAEMLEYSDVLNQLLRDELTSPEVFAHSFSKIKKMAILSPEDGAFKLFNWNVPLTTGVNKFYCYVILPGEDGALNTVTEFKHATRAERKMDNRYLDTDQWYGCLYYDVITAKKNKISNYTILGYSPFSKASTKKYIDVLTINNGEVRLGAPIFKTEKGIKKRVIFEFSAEVSMTVRWQEESDRIIMDHLTPRTPEMEGNFMFYGPDGTFDQYTLDKGMWEYQESVEFISTDKSSKPYKDPRKRKGRR